MTTQIEQAIRQIVDEKGLSYESVMETIETAMAAAYRKDFGEKNQNIEVEFDVKSGDIKVYDVKTVVPDMSEEELEAQREREMERREAARIARQAAETAGEVTDQKESTQASVSDSAEAVSDEEKIFNPKTDIMITEAKTYKADAALDDVIRISLDVPGDFGRMAAQTAKQVITQKLREAEREIIFNEFKDLENEVIIGTVQRKEGRVVLVDFGRTTGIMRSEDQISTEHYVSGERFKFFIREVSLGARGPEILVSRTAEGLVQRLFEMEIPEIADGIVVIKAIAREGGARSKVAVYTEDDSIDPIGACIGQRGTRIQTIIAELGGEKVDIIEWSEDPETFIINSLSPAKIVKAELNQDEKTAMITVDPDQLSLAIGRGGQNVRLAAKLTDWKINISEEGPEEDKGKQTDAEEEPSASSLPGADQPQAEDRAQSEQEENNAEAAKSEEPVATAEAPKEETKEEEPSDE